MCLIIGYGSPLRCDDRLGPYLAETLAEAWQHTTVINSIQLTPELAEPISRAKQVVFIDASLGDMPGTICCKNVVAEPANGAFTHNVTPSSLLAAAETLYGAAPRAILISISAGTLEYGCTFSSLVEALLPQITVTVRAIIDAFLAPQEERHYA
jgi:hydrogenase maturation protease